MGIAKGQHYSVHATGYFTMLMSSAPPLYPHKSTPPFHSTPHAHVPHLEQNYWSAEEHCEAKAPAPTARMLGGGDTHVNAGCNNRVIPATTRGNEGRSQGEAWKGEEAMVADGSPANQVVLASVVSPQLDTRHQ